MHKQAYTIAKAAYMNTTLLSPTFLFTQSKATRPTMRPPKKPLEIYPEDGPPPRSLIINVTIHPDSGYPY